MWCFKTIMGLTLLSLATARPTKVPSIQEFIRPYLSDSYYDRFNREDLSNFISKSVTQILQNSQTTTGNAEMANIVEQISDKNTEAPWEGGVGTYEKYQPLVNAMEFSTAAPYEGDDESSEKHQSTLINTKEETYSTAAPNKGDDELLQEIFEMLQVNNLQQQQILKEMTNYFRKSLKCYK